jgi:hypothetical protein
MYVFPTPMKSIGIRADKFRDKMIKEYRKFWNKERTKLRNKA